MRLLLLLTSMGTAVFLAAGVVGLAPAAGATSPTYSNGFESDAVDWTGSIVREASGSNTSAAYAPSVAAASGSYLARLPLGSCYLIPSGGGEVNQCDGPFTRWGGYNDTPLPDSGYTIQLDIYLDTAWAMTHNDTRFDFSSAVTKANSITTELPRGQFLRDFVFNVGTDSTTSGFVVSASNNSTRSGANPYQAANRQNIGISGWYTFRHTFHKDSVSGKLAVYMDIIMKASGITVAHWTLIDQDDPISTVSCNRYGWFVNQEIPDLPIDNARMTGCGTPPPRPHHHRRQHHHQHHHHHSGGGGGNGGGGCISQGG